MFVERIAPLVSAAIANAQMIRALQRSAGQRQALYEMSQQIAASLDLRTTLKRAIQWISRLAEVEVGHLAGR